jgi:hypothetical protein
MKTVGLLFVGRRNHRETNSSQIAGTKANRAFPVEETPELHQAITKTYDAVISRT